jgi:hypothetical protein
MKKILKISYFVVLILLIPFSGVLGQEKKNEQKIKIIVNDGSGTKVMIDTVLHGDNGPDSLTLKDGSVVRLKHPKGEGKHIFVTYSDEKDGKGLTKEMTVVSTDSMDWKADRNPDVILYNNDRDGHHRYKVISRSSGEGNDMEETVIVKDRRGGEGSSDIFDKYVSDEPGVEKTRFVIAKDGMVVTIEGTDEAKAKELAKEIEQKLGVSGKEDNKEVSKSKTQKKTVK